MDTRMMITLDHLAERYHVLPSVALATATTLDLRVLDVGNAWNRHQQEKQKLQAQMGIDPRKVKSKAAPKELSQEEMKAMLARTRNPDAKNRHKAR